MHEAMHCWGRPGEVCKHRLEFVDHCLALQVASWDLLDLRTQTNGCKLLADAAPVRVICLGLVCLQGCFGQALLVPRLQPPERPPGLSCERLASCRPAW